VVFESLWHRRLALTKKDLAEFFFWLFVSVVVLRQTGAPGASNACFFSPSSRPPFSSRLLGHRHHHHSCYLSLCVLQRVAGDCEAWTQAAGLWNFYVSLHSCEGTDISGSLKLIEVLGLGAEEKTVMLSRERGFWIFLLRSRYVVLEATFLAARSLDERWCSYR
jgi:hypothetical protein